MKNGSHPERIVTAGAYCSFEGHNVNVQRLVNNAKKRFRLDVGKKQTNRWKFFVPFLMITSSSLCNVMLYAEAAFNDGNIGSDDIATRGSNVQDCQQSLANNDLGNYNHHTKNLDNTANPA